MTGQDMKRIFTSHEGILFTLIFTFIFIITNLIMIDFRGIQAAVTGQTPFFILTLIVILAYLYKNSSIRINKTRGIFVIAWSLYVASMMISMAVNNDFVWPEAVVLVMLTVMFFYRMPKELLIIMTASALISLPALLVQHDTLNESGATLVLIYTAGLIFLPKHNMAMLYYALPAFALLLLITLSRTAIAVFIVVTILQLIYINLYRKSRVHRKRFFITLGGVLAGTSIIFIRPIYRFFTEGSITAAGVDLNRLTSGRYEPWMHILNNMSWFGDGRNYIDFTELLHVHNIFLDTLGRYGVMTAMLFVVVLGILFVLSVPMGLKHGFNFGLFIVAFVLIGMFEYNYLFMFVYFSPVVLLFVVGTRVVSVREEGIKKDMKRDL